MLLSGTAGGHMTPIPESLWVYRADIERVVDGDTVVAVIDCGFGLHLYRGNEGARLRLLGVDSPERIQRGWAAARDFTLAWVREAGQADESNRFPFIIRTSKADAFGRYLSTVWRISDGACLNDALLDAGHAVVKVPAP
jgi:micrococcal nuclease